MCTKSIAFAKALAHTCLQILPSKNWRNQKLQTKQKQKRFKRKAGTLARPAFSFGREIFQDVWPGEGHSKCRVVGARIYEGYAGTCSATNGHLTERML